MDIEKVIRKINDKLKKDKEYKDDTAMKVQYILLDKNNKIDDIVCYGWDGMVSVNPKTYEIEHIHDWAYSYDEDIFEKLKDGKTIGYMNYEIHYDIWCSINECYPEDIDCHEGLDLYIKYCDKYGITKEYLDKKMELSTPDIMDNFTDVDENGILEYKSYIASIDKADFDTHEESLVYIYQSQRDFTNRDYIECVSLSNEKIKKNIKSYIDKNYFLKMNNNPNYESQKSYFAFVLGYELLQDMLKNSTIQECDLIHNFCNYEAEKFLESGEYLNLKYSSYEMLTKWVEKNKETIFADYKKMTNGEIKIFNGNMQIIDKGFRGEQPIALVEKTLADNDKTYIIAFYYKTNGDKLDWGYGYYYDTNMNKAKEDYEKVIKGDSIADTFEKGGKDYEK